jgi:hypothetical protein
MSRGIPTAGSEAALSGQLRIPAALRIGWEFAPCMVVYFQLPQLFDDGNLIAAPPVEWYQYLIKE